MRKCLLAGVLLLCLNVGGVFAQEPPITAVPNIKGTDVAKAIVSTCRSMVETALIKTNEFSVLSYTDVEQILSAQEFSLSDCTDEACAVEIGKLLAAEQIVVGELTAIGTKMILSIRLVNVATGKSLRAETVDIASVDDLREGAFQATYSLAGLKYIPGADVGVQEVGQIYVTAPAGKVLDVYVDGKLKGQTPLVVEGIPFGTHVLEAKQDEYVFRQEISIRSKEIEEIFADVQALTGNLILEIEPADATGYTVRVDGVTESAGLIKGISTGPRTIRISGAGWFYEGTVTIEPDQNTRQRVTLSQSGQIRLAFPEGGTARLQSADFSTELAAGFTETVAVGRYSLIVEHEDYKRYVEEVEVPRGRIIEVVVEMERTETYTKKLALEELRTRREAILKTRSGMTAGGWISGGIGIAAAAATGILGYLASERIVDLEVAYDAYERSSISSELGDLWTAVEAERGVLEKLRIGLIGSVAGTGVSLTLSGVFFAGRPSTKKLDAEIERLEAELE